MVVEGAAVVGIGMDMGMPGIDSWDGGWASILKAEGSKSAEPVDRCVGCEELAGTNEGTVRGSVMDGTADDAKIGGLVVAAGMK